MPVTPPPKPGDYIVVDGSDGPRRDFRISVGLREGWDAEGRVFDVSEAVRTARAWMRRRVEAGEPALSGMVTRAEVTPFGTVKLLDAVNTSIVAKPGRSAGNLYARNGAPTATLMLAAVMAVCP